MNDLKVGNRIIIKKMVTFKTFDNKEGQNYDTFHHIVIIALTFDS